MKTAPTKKEVEQALIMLKNLVGMSGDWYVGTVVEYIRSLEAKCAAADEYAKSHAKGKK